MVVLHSGAGGLAPAIAERCDRLAGLIFIDAVLPHPGRSWADTAPPGLADRLRGLAEDGMLPTWDRWFPADAIARLLPDAPTREAFLRDLPPTPLAWLDAPSPRSAEWEAIPAAFVQLSDAYADEAAEADRLGWTVRRFPLHHLAMLSDPAKVAALLMDVSLSLLTK
ncbi:MAG: hypothetical protein ACHP84_13000 [Caulobacterales bacterium]